VECYDVGFRFRIALDVMYRANEFDRFLTCLTKTGLHVHDMLFQQNDELINKVENIPSGNLHGDLLNKQLVIISWVAPHMGNQTYPKLLPLLQRVTKQSHVGAQRTFLTIMFEVLKQLELAHLQELIPTLDDARFVHSDASCRALFYKILIWIWDNHPGYQDLKRDEPMSSIVRRVNKALLKGLSDPSPEVRHKLLEFWDDDNRVPTAVAERLVCCLHDLYHPDSESEWLRYVVFLLMQPSHKGVDFKRPFSENPLQECKFNHLNVNSRHRSRHTFAPMFSQSSLLEDEEMSPNDIPGEERPAGMVMRTQTPGFEQTMSQSLMNMDAKQLLENQIRVLASQSQNQIMMFAPTLRCAHTIC
jgi:hypothetical protein